MMPESIRMLSSDVLNKLKAQPHIISVTSAVKELIENSLDAHASKIEILLELKSLRIMVKDNGSGIKPEDLDLLGTPYMTSKLKKMDDLLQISTYGFRGEALNNIINMSNTTIYSKLIDYNSTWMRKFPLRAKMCDISISFTADQFDINNFPIKESGTVVYINSLMDKLPVRRNMLLKEPEFKIRNALKLAILPILIKNPTINIKITNIGPDGERGNILDYNGLSSMLNERTVLYVHILRSIFGEIVPNNTLKEVSVSFKECNVKGIISKCPLRTRDLQYIFINGRVYKNDAFNRRLTEIFNASGFCNGTSLNCITKSVGHPFNHYPMFLIEVVCPKNLNDMIQSPEKIIRISSYNYIIHPLVEKVLKVFLSSQGYKIEDNERINRNEADLSLGGNITIIPSNSNSNKLFDVDKLYLDSQIKAAGKNKRELAGRLTNQVELNNSNNKIMKPRLRTSMSSIVPGIFKDTRIDRMKPLNLGSSWLEIKRNNITDINQDYFELDEIHVSRNNLTDSRTINQVGDKFILIEVKPELPIGKKNIRYIIILDQHACDERIKLEEYISTFMRSVLDKTLFMKPSHNFNFQLEESEASMLLHFRKEFHFWGIEYEIQKDRLNKYTIHIQSLSDILSQKVRNDMMYMKKILLQHGHDIKESKKPMLSNMKSQKQKMSQYLNCIPMFYMEIFNSKACRAAIMFGDTLTKNECELLVHKLSACWLPFQCAHGRPSMVPIGILNDDPSNTSCTSKGIPLDYAV